MYSKSMPLQNSRSIVYIYIIALSNKIQGHTFVFSLLTLLLLPMTRLHDNAHRDRRSNTPCIIFSLRIDNPELAT